MKVALLLALVLYLGDVQAATLQHLTSYDSREVRGAFLSRGAGARPVGMGGAFAAIADDASAVSWNPGGLGQLESFSGVAMYESGGPDMGYSYVALAAPVGNGVAGASVAMVNYGTYDVRDAFGVKSFTDNLTDVAATFSLGLRNPAWLGEASWSGLSLEVVNEAVGRPLVGASVGALVAFKSQLSLGLAVQHLGPKVDGFGLPSVAKVGAAYGGWKQLRLSADLAYPLVTQQVWAAGGVEYSLHPAIALRGGYKWQSQAQGFSGLVGLTAGAGVRYEGFGIDYAYQPFGELATSHRVALVYGVGETTAKSHAKPLRTSKRGPVPVGTKSRHGDDMTQLYRALYRLYYGDDYDGALTEAEAIVKANPREWKAWHLIGHCLHAKGDRKGAFKAYARSLKINPDNPQLQAWVDQLKRR